ncbi:CoA transferase [Skermanella stibiiresistens SB22]|uniref:CoA transferase n=1 Tax=Skermanella stibiiresistens SB22 TaxID=1385369 RepID=W9H6L9_9PROT|nr:CaiB/BaiF CoA-transferase family protein [Skermanella stibiiresistens]EWY41880.1 CoA transferase [Skermanella stibiiresistens SB22]
MTSSSRPAASGPLAGLKVFDMTRVLAGPSATQVLGDLGADVIKVERPGQGDDTRKWGPPYVRDGEGANTTESAYYLSANRNKRSITLDFTKPEGQALARRMIAQSDILLENYKVGTLSRYNLGYEQLKDEFPGLIYCSITGFGQTGPYAPRAGYDFLVQAMGGIMSVTGEPDGDPQKIGVGVADLMTGMYGLVGMLAALHHREKTGKGQHIDMALLDTQVAWLSYVGQYYLTSGEAPPRMGNAHPTIVPYEAFPASDGYVILGIGNDGQYGRFCQFAGHPELASDARFATNEQRVRNRLELIPILRDLVSRQPREHWLAGLAPLGVPCSPINTVDQVFDDPQVKARGMAIAMPHALAPEPIPLIASPMKLSDTPVDYRHAPPTLGQHTDEVLGEWLGLGEDDISKLRDDGIV